MITELPGSVAVVTGAASGIGRAVASRCAAEGMKVVLADIEEPRLNDARAELSDRGATVLAVRTDVSDGASMAALAEEALKAFGKIHLVHLNAGVATGGPIWQLTDADWKWVLGVNLWGVIHGVQAFVPILIEQGEPAHVVNTASMAGLTSAPFMGAYNVSKHGVVTISETLKRELGMFGSHIGVSVLCPGWVDTNIGESGRNRPAELSGGSGELADLGGGALRGVLESGLAPAQVADLVLEAVKTDRFYILTHPEWNDLIKARMEDILEDRAPQMMMFPM